MKRQIRKGVFETNSSSTHAICITQKDVDISGLPTHITFTHGDFGWAFDIHKDTRTKASYLYQAICDLCYKDNGKHGDILNAKFLDTLHPYTELAINGNDLSHPDLIPFLQKLKEKKVIANMTVNQIHFEKNQDLIRDLVDKGLIFGLGVSLRDPTPEFITLVKKYPNAVIHTINGILSEEDVKLLAKNGLKILILGYKNLRRGEDWYSVDKQNIEAKQDWLRENLPNVINQFEVVSFDNLAIKQLDVKRLITEEEWVEFYMGDDGKYTFYIDMVSGTFAKNSLSLDRYPIMDSIDDMFKKVIAL